MKGTESPGEGTVTLEVKYELGHSYSETWTTTDLYCPNCGTLSVWVEAGAGDYYEGPRHLCLDCGSGFSLPRLDNGQGWQDEQRREAINRV